MLVLSRKPGERIRIGEDILVTIVRIGPNNVRLGIDAPRELNVVRTEIEVGTRHGDRDDDRGRSDRPAGDGRAAGPVRQS